MRPQRQCCFDCLSSCPYHTRTKLMLVKKPKRVLCYFYFGVFNYKGESAGFISVILDAVTQFLHGARNCEINTIPNCLQLSFETREARLRTCFGCMHLLSWSGSYRYEPCPFLLILAVPQVADLRSRIWNNLAGNWLLFWHFAGKLNFEGLFACHACERAEYSFA